MTEAELEINSFEPHVDNLISNKILLELFEENWKEIAGYIEKSIEKPLGSTDVGNVSHTVPTIHPMIAIAPEDTALHTKEFAEAARSEKTYEALLNASKTMATTAIDLLTSPKLVKKTKNSFKDCY